MHRVEKCEFLAKLETVRAWETNSGAGAGGRFLFCSTRRFRTANSTPLISISRHFAPFEKLGWKAVTLKGFFSEFGPTSFVGIEGVKDCRSI
jgi:hypothetical protein